MIKTVLHIMKKATAHMKILLFFLLLATALFPTPACAGVLDSVSWFHLFFPVLVCAVILAAFWILWNKNRKIRNLESLDQLTGLYNLPGFREAARDFLVNIGFTDAYLFYIDFNQFKYINTYYGYAVGDEILQEFSHRLLRIAGHHGIVGKVESDHFLMLVKNSHPIEYYNRLLEHSLAHVMKKVEDLHVSISCGIYPVKEYEDIYTLIDRANYAKDFKRNTHSNTFMLYNEEMLNRLNFDKELENMMEDSLKKGEFLPYYQPKADIRSGVVVGCEALVRWQHPQRGLLPPSFFVPLFERNGFIRQIDMFMFKKVCQDIQQTMQANRRVVPVSCNFARVHFMDSSFATQVAAIAAEYAVPLKYLELEITETAAITDFEAVKGQLTTLKKMGFAISIDDFGSGYSSLGILARLDADIIKMDKIFIDQAQDSYKGRLLIEAIVALAHKLGIRVICEGVEEQEQADFLLGVGCTLVQGYLYGKPMPREDFQLLADETLPEETLPNAPA